MRPLKKRRVHWLIERGFWDGFWRRMAGPRGIGGRGKVLSFIDAPGWWDDVTDIAAKAGWDAAEQMLARQEKDGRLSMGHRPEIPGSVYAEAYGAARISCGT